MDQFISGEINIFNIQVLIFSVSSACDTPKLGFFWWKGMHVIHKWAQYMEEYGNQPDIFVWQNLIGGALDK